MKHIKKDSQGLHRLDTDDEEENDHFGHRMAYAVSESPCFTKYDEVVVRNCISLSRCHHEPAEAGVEICRKLMPQISTSK